MNKNKIYWWLQIGGWFLYGLLQIISSALASATISPRRILFLLYEALLCLLVTHLFRSFLIRSKWFNLSLPKLIPGIMVSVCVMAFTVYFARMPVSLLLGFFDLNVAFDVRHILGLTSVYVLIFFLWSVLYFTYYYFERYNRSLKYEASVIEIELSNLKSQLNPHFIFNALNSIRALVDENPAKSKQAINQLSNILRSSLASDKKDLTSFNEELKTVKDYLGLESIRFEERLRTEFDIDPASQHFLVPPLMIQTLVENGIKHGISKLTAGGLIQVKTQVEKDRLRIHIRNSGHIANGSRRNKNGLGLKNTAQRLKLIYSGTASFRIVNENDNFVLTEVIIPQTHNL